MVENIRELQGSPMFSLGSWRIEPGETAFWQWDGEQWVRVDDACPDEPLIVEVR